MELLKQQIQALIFCSEQSISIDEITASLKLSFDWDVTDEEVLSAIEEIKQQFSTDDFSFELVEISEGFQFLTKKQYYPAVSALIQHKAKKKLSVSQMETLAIIAYRQPIAKSEVEHIRGVSCDYAVQKLLEKELIEISGKSDGPGRPVLYRTSDSFMDYFGIKSVKDLPQLKDLHVEHNEIGTPADVMSDNDQQAHIISELPGDYSSNEMPSGENDEELSVEEIIEITAESNEDLLTDSESALFIHDSEQIDEETENIQALEDDEITSVEEFNSDDEISIPDRKTIFLENEAKEVNEEEEREEE
jgi:segregation and condensation protein B